MTSEYERGIEEIIEDMKDPAKTQKGRILKLAELLERNNCMKDIRDICAKLCKDLLGKAEHIKKHHIYDALPDKYKHIEKAPKAALSAIISSSDDDGNQISESRDSDVGNSGRSDDEDYSNYQDEEETQKSRHERLKTLRESYSPGAKYYRTAMKVTGASKTRSPPQQKQEEEGFEDDTNTDEIKRKNSKLRGIIVEQEQEIAQLQGVIKQRDERIVKLEQEVEYWKAGR